MNASGGLPFSRSMAERQMKPEATHMAMLSSLIGLTSSFSLFNAMSRHGAGEPGAVSAVQF